jgi:hypothetical protein
MIWYIQRVLFKGFVDSRHISSGLAAEPGVGSNAGESGVIIRTQVLDYYRSLVGGEKN